MSYRTPTAFPLMDMFFAMQRSYLELMFNQTRAITPPTPARALKIVETDHVAEVNEQVVGIGEEVLAITTRRVPGAATRVRRVVNEVPVERPVELHDETITIERRPANGSAGGEVLTEREFVMIDTREIPVVTKHPHVREELVLRKEITGRVEMVHETLKRTDVEVIQPQRMPAVFANKSDSQHQHH